jgi:hypothetical protein
MKKSPIIVAAALSLVLAGCSAKQRIDPSRMSSRSEFHKVESLYSLSESAIKEGKYPEATNYLEKMLVEDGRTEQNVILFNYGMARNHLEMSKDNLRERQNNRVLALRYFEKVIELTDGDARFNSYRVKSDSWAKYLRKE